MNKWNDREYDPDAIVLPSPATSTLITLPSSVLSDVSSCQSSALQTLTVWSKPDDARKRPLRDMTSGLGLSSLSPLSSTSISPCLAALETSSALIKAVSSAARKNRTSETEDLCAGTVYATFRARMSHIRIESSPEPAAIWYLSTKGCQR